VLLSHKLQGWASAVWKLGLQGTVVPCKLGSCWSGVISHPCVGLGATPKEMSLPCRVDVKSHTSGVDRIFGLNTLDRVENVTLSVTRRV
jgi:hypothetical protein